MPKSRRGERPSRWQPEDFAGAEDLLRNNGVFCNASDTALAAEFAWEHDAFSAIRGGATSLLQFNSRVTHPTAGNGLAFRLLLPVSADEAELCTLADTLNEIEIAGVDVPPAFGAWAYLPQMKSVAYTGFWLNCIYQPGTVAKIASWCKIRSKVARQVIGNRN